MCQENINELEESINDYFDYGKNDIIFERYEKAIENLIENLRKLFIIMEFVVKFFLTKMMLKFLNLFLMISNF